MTEVLGFVTGGACVWLLVRQHIWNWPIGLANNLFFFVLFLRARLFADMGLQLVYFALGVYGWIQWSRGRAGREPLRISRATRGEWLALAALVPVVTWKLREVLIAASGASPFGDALTTALSLGAQYLQCRKRLENWYLWIAADVVYIPIYLRRGLPLTAVLYTVFLVMCLVGLREWTRQWRQAAAARDRPAA
jgi:nicotinamide mononucleotide transporter